MQDTYYEFWKEVSVGTFSDFKYVFAILAITYLPIIFGLKYFVEKYDINLDKQLKFPLFCWNLFLGGFSLWGTYYTFGSLYWFPICDRSRCYLDKQIIHVVMLYNLSKPLEFIDTLFIVLRRKPLIFLHYYHHIATFLYCWYANQYSGEYNCGGFHFAAVNLFVHAIMYNYYAAMTYYRFSRWVSKSITTLQILQMIYGMGISIATLFCKEIDYVGTFIVFGLYFSYFILFYQMYKNRYSVKTNKVE